MKDTGHSYIGGHGIEYPSPQCPEDYQIITVLLEQSFEIARIEPGSPLLWCDFQGRKENTPEEEQAGRDEITNDTFRSCKLYVETIDGEVLAISATTLVVGGGLVGTKYRAVCVIPYPNARNPDDDEYHEDEWLVPVESLNEFLSGYLADIA